MVGLGDGAWSGGDQNKSSIQQAIGRSVRRVFNEIDEEQKKKIKAIEFCQFGTEKYVQAFDPDGSLRGSGSGIEIISSINAPFSYRLTGDYENCQLCVNFAWDGGSYVGNEYWAGKLTASGDPAAACCSSIAVSMNPDHNREFLDRLNVVTRGGRVEPIEYFSKSPIINYVKDLIIDNSNPYLLTFQQGINSQTNNINPTSSYRGIGVRAQKVAEGFKITNVFSPEVERFYDSSGKILDLEGGLIITQVKKDGEFVNVLKLSDKDLAKQFHKNSEVEFKIKNNTGQEITVKCDNRKNKLAIFAPEQDQSGFMSLSKMLDENLEQAKKLIEDTLDMATKARETPMTSVTHPHAVVIASSTQKYGGK